MYIRSRDDRPEAGRLSSSHPWYPHKAREFFQRYQVFAERSFSYREFVSQLVAVFSQNRKRNTRKIQRTDKLGMDIKSKVLPGDQPEKSIGPCNLVVHAPKTRRLRIRLEDLRVPEGMSTHLPVVLGVLVVLHDDLAFSGGLQRLAQNKKAGKKVVQAPRFLWFAMEGEAKRGSASSSSASSSSASP